MITDKKIALQKVRQDGLRLRHASDELRNDREIVFEAVKSKGLAFKYSSFELKNDKEFVLMHFNLCD